MSFTSDRILLSAPQAAPEDFAAVQAALESGWLAPIGPDLDHFEVSMRNRLGLAGAVGLASGTAGLHLALKYLGVGPGDYVLIPTVTFGATAFSVTYLGAVPVFIDVDSSWNMDWEMSQQAIVEIRSSGAKVGAAVPVDLYGTPADYSRLLPMFAELDVPVIEDAAEGLGANHDLGPVGTFGAGAVLSFNGNKIITTSGGGMLVTNDLDLAAKVRYWATQSRENYPWYEHEEIGFNYRLSNILAALGTSQLSRLDEIVAHRRQVRQWYREGLANLTGVVIQDDPPWGTSNAWLSVATFDLELFPEAPMVVREALEFENIESRPVWKPMHQQPVFASNPTFLNGTADALYASGLCLPSGPSMTHGAVSRVCRVIQRKLK